MRECQSQDHLPETQTTPETKEYDTERRVSTIRVRTGSHLQN